VPDLPAGRLPSCWDSQAGYCTDDSPRRGEIAGPKPNRLWACLGGIASAFGITDAVKTARQAAEQRPRPAGAAVSNCDRLAPAGNQVLPRIVARR